MRVIVSEELVEWLQDNHFGLADYKYHVLSRIIAGETGIVDGEYEYVVVSEIELEVLNDFDNLEVV